MRSLSFVLLLAAGCGFKGGPGNGLQQIDANDQIGSDGPGQIDAFAPPPPDAQFCVGVGLVKHCFDSPPTGARMLTSGTIATDGANSCDLVLTQTSASGTPPALCVIVGNTIMVQSGQTVIATGTRPLVLIAADTITVAGTIDVSSRVNNPARTGAGANTCAATAAGVGTGDGHGGGGGGGGGYSSAGGKGGGGNGGGVSGGAAGSLVAAPAFVGGGCVGGAGGDNKNSQGGGGPGGDAGGAVYMVAMNQVTISGSVFASGSGGGANNNDNGQHQGGGGGGAGGLIGLDAPTIELMGGMLAANGGAGGAGGDGSGGGGRGTDAADSSASMPTWNTRAIHGSSPEATGFGDGSDGSAQGMSAMLDGNIGIGIGGGGAGGGGAGGLGFVWTYGTPQHAGNVSPTPSVQSRTGN